jgi:hypothetical protein
VLGKISPCVWLHNSNFPCLRDIEHLWIWLCSRIMVAPPVLFSAIMPAHAIPTVVCRIIRFSQSFRGRPRRPQALGTTPLLRGEQRLCTLRHTVWVSGVGYGRIWGVGLVIANSFCIIVCCGLCPLFRK